MITLKIDNDEDNTAEQIAFLEDIIRNMENGFSSGKNWEITGTEEGEEDEEDFEE